LTLSEALLRWLAGAIAPYLPPPKARKPGVILLRQETDMLVYGLKPAPSTATDVAVREFEEIVNDGAPRLFEGHDGDELSYDRNVTISLKQRDTDASGNVGEWSEAFIFIALDKSAPPKAGQPGLEFIREEP
jgi:hypothetical protein